MNTAATQQSGPLTQGAKLSFMVEAEQAANSAVERLNARATSDYDRQRMELLSRTTDQVKDIRDKAQAERLVKVGTGTMEEIMVDAKRDADDLLLAVTNIDKIISNIGAEYAQLGEKSPEELAVVEDAQKKLEAAYRTWNIFGWREEAVAKAKAALEEANKTANQMQRNRLLNKNLEGVFNYIHTKQLDVKKIMAERIKLLEIQRSNVDKRRLVALDVKLQASKAVTDLGHEIEALERQLDALRGDLVGITEVDKRSEQEGKISNAEVLLKNKRAERDAAHLVQQAKDKFATGLQATLETLIDLKSSINMWVQKLEHEMPERIAMYRARLDTMKAAADQRVAQILDDATARIDPDMLSGIVRDGVVAQKAIVEVVEDMPRRAKEFEQIQKAQREQQTAIIDRMAASIEQFRNRVSNASVENHAA